MSRYTTAFSALKQQGQGAFVPFVMLGDPSLAVSRQIIDTLIEAGADALELGIPFSDPIADGPTIQASAIRALSQGVNTAHCFTLISEVRAAHPDIPIGLLLYANLVAGPGLDNFYQRAAAAGVDSVLVADVPTIEARPFVQAAEAAGIEPIFIAPPNGSPETLARVAELSQGYTYLLSRAGVTGAETEAVMPVDSLIGRLREYQAPPLMLGFGISKPEHVRAALAAGADGVIIGSAIVRLIEQHRNDTGQMLSQLADYVRQIKAACALPAEADRASAGVQGATKGAKAAKEAKSGGIFAKLTRLFAGK